MADIENQEIHNLFQELARVEFIRECKDEEIIKLREQILSNDYRVLGEIKKRYPREYSDIAFSFGWYPQDDAESCKIVHNIIEIIKPTTPKVEQKLSPLLEVFKAAEDEFIPPIELCHNGLMWLREKFPKFDIIVAWLQRYLFGTYMKDIYENIPEDKIDQVLEDAFPEDFVDITEEDLERILSYELSESLTLEQPSDSAESS